MIEQDPVSLSPQAQPPRTIPRPPGADFSAEVLAELQTDQAKRMIRKLVADIVDIVNGLSAELPADELRAKVVALDHARKFLGWVGSQIDVGQAYADVTAKRVLHHVKR